MENFKEFIKGRGELCEYCQEPTSMASRDKHKRGVICQCDWRDIKAEEYAKMVNKALTKENKELREIAEELLYWDTCPEKMKEQIRKLLTPKN